MTKRSRRSPSCSRRIGPTSPRSPVSGRRSSNATATKCSRSSRPSSLRSVRLTPTEDERIRTEVPRAEREGEQAAPGRAARAALVDVALDDVRGHERDVEDLRHEVGSGAGDGRTSEGPEYPSDEVTHNGSRQPTRRLTPRQALSNRSPPAGPTEHGRRPGHGRW